MVHTSFSTTTVPRKISMIHMNQWQSEYILELEKEKTTRQTDRHIEPLNNFHPYRKVSKCVSVRNSEICVILCFAFFGKIGSFEIILRYLCGEETLRHLFDIAMID